MRGLGSLSTTSGTVVGRLSSEGVVAGGLAGAGGWEVFIPGIGCPIPLHPDLRREGGFIIYILRYSNQRDLIQTASVSR